MAADLRTLKLPFFKSTLSEEKTFENEQTLKQWQIEVLQVLHKLQKIINSADLQLDPHESTVIYSILIPLINTEEWTTDDLTNAAIDMLNQLSPPNFEVIELTFLNYIRPLFAKAPHTRIDPNSGRSLPRPAGGLSGSLDFYEKQEWKKAPGLSYLIIWCIKSLKSNEYEKIWHLIVPPSMTFLDDYESYYKLKGTEIINEFIDRVPSELLKRTGIDGLIKTSLNNAILHLHTPLTPKILENSVQASIRLIKLTSSPGSPQMFDQLCALLGDGIIGGVWMYAYQDLETIEISLVVCRKIIQELGIGTTRYLKTILQQLTQYLSMDIVSHVKTQIATLKLLEVILSVCRPRIHAWNVMILDGVLRCWTSLRDKPIPNNEELELSNLLIRTIHQLITIVPSTKALCENLLVLDEKMFAPLFSS